MRKNGFMAMLLCLLMLLVLLPAAALAAPGDAMVFVPDEQHGPEEEVFYAEYVVNVDGTFYGYGQSRNERRVMRWQQGMDAPELFCSFPEFPNEYWDLTSEHPPEVQARLREVVSLVAAGDGKLWGINLYEGRVGEITAQGVQWSDVALDMRDIRVTEGEDEYAYTRMRQVANPRVMGGKLYGIRDNYSEDNWQENRVIVCWDLATGEQTQWPTERAQIYAPYKPGMMLTFGEMYDEKAETYITSLRTLDMATGAEADLPQDMPSANAYELGGLLYDEATDSIFYAFQKQIWRSQGGAPFEPVAYVTMAYTNWYSTASLTPDGMYALSAQGLYLRNVNPQFMSDRPLRISGGWEDTAYRLFSAANPDVPVLMSYNYMNGEEVATAIMSGDTQVDIYVVNANQGLRDLIHKGFTVDLSESAVLAADLAAMYPQIQATVSDAAGKPMAYPRDFNFSPWTVDSALWERFDMGPMPTTYSEFFDYMLRWNEEYADDNPDIRFMEGSYNGSSLAEVVLHNYVLQYEDPGQPIDFSAPVLREALEKVAALNLKTIDYENMTDIEREEFENLWRQQPIFFMYARGGIFYDPDRTRYVSSDPDAYREGVYQSILPMAFEQGKQSPVRASMSAYIINPASKNIDLALRYLECAAQEGAEAYLRYAIHPEMNEPLEDEYYQESLESMKRWGEELAERAKDLEGVDLRDVQDSIDYVNRWLADESANRWAISPKALTNFREMAVHMTFAADSAFFKQGEGGAAMNMMREMMGRYAQGALPLDALLRELDSKMRMVILEGN